MNIQLIRPVILAVVMASAASSAWAVIAVYRVSGTVTSSLSGDHVDIDGHSYRINKERISPADLHELTIGNQVDLQLDASPDNGEANIISVTPHSIQ